MNTYLLLVIGSLGVAAFCLAVGWLVERANRRWPAASGIKDEASD